MPHDPGRRWSDDVSDPPLRLAAQRGDSSPQRRSSHPRATASAALAALLLRKLDLLPAQHPAIELRGVIKRYGEITAVNGLDLAVPAGVCFGLLGPNGAGKSTTMRMLTAQTLADEGSIEVLGPELPGASKAGAYGDGRGAAARQPGHRAHLSADPRCIRAPERVPRAERATAVEAALQIANLPGPTRSRTSSRAGCAGACSSPGA